MNRISAFVIVAAVAVLLNFQGAAFAQDDTQVTTQDLTQDTAQDVAQDVVQDSTKPKGKAILIEIKMRSEVGGNSVVMEPKVLTLEKTHAKIKIGNDKSELNDQPVKSDRDAKDSKNQFLLVMDIVPSIVDGMNPPIIKMDIKISLDHNSYGLKQDFQTVVQNGETFHYKTVDKQKSQEFVLSVTASLSGEKGNKAKVDVETK